MELHAPTRSQRERMGGQALEQMGGLAPRGSARVQDREGFSVGCIGCWGCGYWRIGCNGCNGLEQQRCGPLGVPVLHRAPTVAKTSKRLHPRRLSEHQTHLGAGNGRRRHALQRQTFRIRLAAHFGRIHTKHHGRWRLCALQQALPILGVLFFELGHPPVLVVVAPEFCGQGLLHQGHFFPQKTPEHRVQKRRLGLGVQLFFGRLHRLVHEGVGLIGTDIARAHQSERRAQQLVDRDGGLFAHQEASNDTGSPPLAQGQEKQ